LPVGWPEAASPFQGMVNTAPRGKFLHGALETRDGSLPGVAHNLARGTLKAVALTTTCYATGQTVTFYSGREIKPWQRPQRMSVQADLTIDHVMASAALPLFFPSIPVDGMWYGDGGIRLVAPLGPALHLGADRILVISTGYARSPEEALRPTFDGAPSPAQVLGVLYNAIFLDQLDQDALMLDRMNALLRELPADRRRGLREVKLVVVRPSRDLGALADECELRLPWMFRHLTRRLGTKRARSQDFLSTVMFEECYLRTLIEIGEADGEARADEIAEILCPS
ncbi:MAG: patatin-like phospholipase family protein, partial [Planctomycetota bacterium]